MQKKTYAYRTSPEIFDALCRAIEARETKTSLAETMDLAIGMYLLEFGNHKIEDLHKMGLRDKAVALLGRIMAGKPW